MKRNIFLIVILAIAVAASYNVMYNTKTGGISDIYLRSVEALAIIEDPDIESCQGFDMDILFQDCGGKEKVLRWYFKLSCDGQADNICLEGEDYAYYGCSGNLLYETDNVHTAFCAD